MFRLLAILLLVCSAKSAELATNVGTNSVAAETNLLIESTNIASKPVKTHLKVISYPEGTNADSGQRHPPRPNAAVRFFDRVKSFFGVDNVLHLFNGRDLETFYPWLADSGTFVDRDGVFSVENGMLRISGQHQGFLATRAEFGDYKLVAEFKWGDATWYKHKQTPRNSGLFINANGLDDIDMKAVEVQIMEPNQTSKDGTGDLVLHGGAKMAVGADLFAKSWQTHRRQNGKQIDASMGEWNKMEVLVEGDRVRVTVNGILASEGRRTTPNSGKILLQSNGAEIFFRRLDLYPLDTNNAPSLLQGQGKE